MKVFQLLLILPWAIALLGKNFILLCDLVGGFVVNPVIKFVRLLSRVRINITPPKISASNVKPLYSFTRGVLSRINIFNRDIFNIHKIGKIRIKLPRIHTNFSFLHIKSLKFKFKKFHKRKYVYQKQTPGLEVLVVESARGTAGIKVKIAALSTVGMVAIIGYSVALVKVAHSLPDPARLTSLNNPETTEFYDRDGKLLYRLYEGRNRSLVKLEELPVDVVAATVAIEDQHFFSHNGIDLFGIGRSLWVFYKFHEIQGGSTITQQLIKNTLLSNERTLTRKLKEIVLSMWAETIYSKEEILQMYLNEAPYGGPAWGIEAAARTYFNKSAQALTLPEAAYLAGLPVSPTTYSEFGTNPELGLVRQRQVLSRMLEDKYISKEEYDKAITTQLTFSSAPSTIKAPHFVMYLRAELAKKYGERTVAQGGLKVYSTLDMDLQEVAERIVGEEVTKLSNLNVTNGAALITDARTGEILAMVGSKDYYQDRFGNYNVTTALRQPGSSIKPLTYVTAFKQGYSPGTTLLDVPTSFKNAWETYTPVNYDGKFHGPVSIRTALGSSYNIPAVKMLALVGIPEMVSTAKDLGITTFNDLNRFGLSLTLGGGEVKMVDMMSAYGTFASGGIKHEATGIVKVVDSRGVVLEDLAEKTGERVLSEGQAYLINNILSDNNARTPAFGANSLLKIQGKTVAVKTGTTDLKRDNWTFGYTPEFVVGVWVGNNDNTPMNPVLSSGVTGAAPIWNKIMTSLLEGRQDVAFARPSEVIESVVDGRKDLSLVGQRPKTIVASSRKREQDGDKEKEVVTFSDPFSKTSLDALQQVKVGN